MVLPLAVVVAARAARTGRELMAVILTAAFRRVLMVDKAITGLAALVVQAAHTRAARRELAAQARNIQLLLVALLDQVAAPVLPR
jgi:hypothetical protein